MTNWKIGDVAISKGDFKKIDIRIVVISFFFFLFFFVRLSRTYEICKHHSFFNLSKHAHFLCAKNDPTICKEIGMLSTCRYDYRFMRMASTMI